MIVKVISQIQNGEEVLLGTRGAEDLELDLNEVTCFSDSKQNRIVGLYKRGLYKLTTQSYKNLKKELTQRGIIWRFDIGKRS